MDQFFVKADLVNMMAKKGYTKKDADMIIDDVFNLLAKIMAEGDAIRIHGFGTFEATDHKGRQSTNPQTQEPLYIPGHRVPKFTSGKTLRRYVKEGLYRGDD